jgi:hypothetical protein
MMNIILSTNSIKDVFLTAYWSMYINNSTALIGERGAVSGTREGAISAFRQSMMSTVGMLRSSGKRVYVIADTPGAKRRVIRVMAVYTMLGWKIPEIRYTRREYEQENAVILQELHLLEHAGQASIIYPHETLCDEVWCNIERGGVPLYEDKDHVSDAGARLVVRRLFEASVTARD